MYSRSMGRIPYSQSRPREPSYRQNLRVPPNYSGTAIGSPPPDGVSPATDGIVLPDPPPPSVPSEMGTEECSPKAEAALPVHQEVSPPTAQTAVSPLGGLFSAHGFPFGHGLGFEELLLLGLILFLLHEGESDREDSDLSMTLLLLGALLFCG